jgi:hypothetical protein
VLIGVIRAALLLTGMRGDGTPSVIFLAVASAAGLAGVDAIDVSKQVIARIYVLDARVEFVLSVWWLVDVAPSEVP